MLRFLTSGESHGHALVAILDGLPAGLTIGIDRINNQLLHRQQGYGRSSRQKIEADTIEILGGVRHGVTTGAPLSLMIRNRDTVNWKHIMSLDPPNLTDAETCEQIKQKAVTHFRPGHADLAGTFKFRHKDIRDVLERASARETAARVAVGSVCQQLLSAFGITITSHVVQVGSIRSALNADPTNLLEFEEQVSASEMFCADAAAAESMKGAVKRAWQEGDSLGGIIEILSDGLPVGLGSYTQWDERLDGQLAQAVMSIQAIKAIEIGDGIACSELPGSLAHDALYPRQDTPSLLPFFRKTNRAGGVEGGMTNGSRLRLRAYMKPIPTLRKGLSSLSYPDLSPATAYYERSDICAVPAAAIVVKAMVSFVLARAFLDKFGGDTITDIDNTLKLYREWCQKPEFPSMQIPDLGPLRTNTSFPTTPPEMELE